MVRQLLCLRGIGINSSWLYVMEFFGWRKFRNRREVGALAGLTPTPHQSGDEAWERGISKAGNRYIRSMAIQIAWAWLRWQPQSQLSRWYEQRFGNGSPRLRRIGIVALARKLLVDLWRYLENGVIPEGAQLKAQRANRLMRAQLESTSVTFRAGVSCPYKIAWSPLRNRQLDGAAHPGASRIACGRYSIRCLAKIDQHG